MHCDSSSGHEMIILVVDNDIELRLITRRHSLECAIFGTAMKVASKGAVEQLTHVVGSVGVCSHCADSISRRKTWHIELSGGEVNAFLGLKVTCFAESGMCQCIDEQLIVMMTPHVYWSESAV